MKNYKIEKKEMLLKVLEIIDKFLEIFNLKIIKFIPIKHFKGKKYKYMFEAYTE